MIKYTSKNKDGQIVNDYLKFANVADCVNILITAGVIDCSTVSITECTDLSEIPANYSWELNNLLEKFMYESDEHKREYAIGDTVQMGLMTLVCVEDKICDCTKCCVFYSKDVSCPDMGECSHVNRTDKKDVIFKLKEE